MKRTIRNGIIATLAALVFMVPTTAMAAEQPAQDASTTQVGTAKIDASFNVHTQQELDEFLLSSTPKEVTLDPDTGAVLTVTDPSTLMESKIVHNNYCNTFSLCLINSNGSDNNGFTGAGIRAGRWTNIKQWRTLAITAGQVRWNTNGQYIDSPKMGSWTWTRWSSARDIVRVRIW